jgi:hypothetical protein
LTLPQLKEEELFTDRHRSTVFYQVPNSEAVLPRDTKFRGSHRHLINATKFTMKNKVLAPRVEGEQCDRNGLRFVSPTWIPRVGHASENVEGFMARASPSAA